MIGCRFRIVCMAKQPTTSEPAERTVASYPYYPLRKCIALGEVVKDYGGGRTEVPKSVIAQQLGVGESSSVFSMMLTSAKTFGIVEGARSYSLTEEGQRFFFPTNDTDRRQAELGFLASPSAFKLLLDRFDGNRLPATPMLANILLRDGSVTKSWATRAAALFLSSATELAVTDTVGFLRYKAALHSLGAEGKANGRPDKQPDFVFHKGDQVFVGEVKVSPDPGKGGSGQRIDETSRSGAKGVAAHTPGANVWVFTEGGGTVRLETPDSLPPALWVRLRKYVEMLEPVPPEKGEAT
jgi:hypothetical protein